MAIVILCGLTSSTLLNMFVVPTLYLKFADAGPARSNRTETSEFLRKSS
jgi:Cu/Ag efflux pump CusA